MNSDSKISSVTRRNFITAGGAATVGALSAGFLPATAAAALPNPSQVYIKSVSYGGSGCPLGSFGQSFSDDRQSLTLIFDKYVVSSGPGIPVTENRKNCQLLIDIRVPPGFSYTVASVNYQGFVSLPTSVSAQVNLIYYFQGESVQAKSAIAFQGAVIKDYSVRDTLGLGALAWMPCGRVVPLNVNTQARIIQSSNLPAKLTTSSIDGKVKITLGLQWRNC